jgi:predicted phosphodiesterase
MIWVIGDIHGMLDPLKRILAKIRQIEERDEPVEKIIFIGDYIDHGPSSKEVIDLIQGLEYEKVCLAGNHEDLVLRFMNQDELYLEKNGNLWFNNGAVDTYESIYDNKDHADLIRKLIENRDKFLDLYNYTHILDSYEGLELPEKYESFFKGLKYSHREEFKLPGKRLRFAFLHGLPRPSLGLGEQMVGSYADFTGLLMGLGGSGGSSAGDDPDARRKMARNYSSNLEHSHLWNRDYGYSDGSLSPEAKSHGGEIVVHGHTPTIFYHDYYSENDFGPLYGQFARYQQDLRLPFLFSRSKESGYGAGGQASCVMPPGRGRLWGPIGDNSYLCGRQGGVEAINVDTAAVYGGALTALGLSATYLASGIMPLLTVRTSVGQRSPGDKVLARAIHAHRLGGPAR